MPNQIIGHARYGEIRCEECKHFWRIEYDLLPGGRSQTCALSGMHIQITRNDTCNFAERGVTDEMPKAPETDHE